MINRLNLILWIIYTFFPDFIDCYINLKDYNRVQVPHWSFHKYQTSSQESHKDLIVRHYLLQENDKKSYLLCPKNYVIGQLAYMILAVNTTRIERPDLKTIHFNKILNETLIHDNGDVDHQHEDHVVSHDPNTSICPTLKNCLLFQACVFSFGNEFCLQDPAPGTRKLLETNITCVRSDVMRSKFANNLVIQKEFEERSKKVLQIHYKSRLDGAPDPLKVDLVHTDFKYRYYDINHVFGAQCPEDPREAGYQGECFLKNLSNEEIIERTWHTLSRVPNLECRKKVIEVFCSYVYNDRGMCVPPHLLIKEESKNSNSNNNENSIFENIKFNFNSYPITGKRPPNLHEKLEEIKNHNHSSLIPVKIGFAILIHKNVPAVIQMLETIYRPQHFYVFHVDYRADDVREDLRRRIDQRFINSNIKILPKERSFIASWGSWSIVRAQLEIFEELARMGIWDFMINMSGADLPLRSIDDVTFALAPYRGHNFLSFHKDEPRNQNISEFQGLCYEAWSGCDGFTYNITRSHGMPHISIIKLRTASQWAVLSRDFIEDLLNQDSHPILIKKYNYYMQTSIIPDESYLPSIAINHPKYAKKSHRIGLYYLKQFEGKDVYNLCRHTDDADFCGQGPSNINENDISHLSESSHRYFFARKFETDNVKDPNRDKIIQMAQGEYYWVINNYIPKIVMNQLMINAAKAYDANLVKIDHAILHSLKVFPLLNSSQPCCSLAFDRHFKSVQEYYYLLDFEIISSQTNLVKTPYRAKYSMNPQCICYPRGDLRAIRATTWTQDGTEEKKQLSINAPFPYFPAHSKKVFIELWFHLGNESLSDECRKQAWKKMPKEFGVATIDGVVEDPLTGNITKPGDPFFLNFKLLDPLGNARCIQDEKITWTNENIHLDKNKRHEKAFFLQMKCGPMESGIWTLEIRRLNVPKPFVYKLKLFHIPQTEYEILNMVNDNTESDLLRGFWKLESVVKLPIMETQKEITTELPKIKVSIPPPPPSTINSGETSQRTRNDFFSKKNPAKFIGIWDSLADWFLCNGGFVTTLICLFFAYHWLDAITMFENRERYINNPNSRNFSLTPRRHVVSGFKIRAIQKSLVMIITVSIGQYAIMIFYCCN